MINTVSYGMHISADQVLHTIEAMVLLISDCKVKDKFRSFNVLCIITAQQYWPDTDEYIIHEAFYELT